MSPWPPLCAFASLRPMGVGVGAGAARGGELAVHTLDDHQLDLAGAVLLPERRGLLVLGRVVAGDRLVEARELDDDEPGELFRALEDLELAAAGQDLAAEFRDDPGHEV